MEKHLNIVRNGLKEKYNGGELLLNSEIIARVCRNNGAA